MGTETSFSPSDGHSDLGLEHSELPEPNTVAEDNVADRLFDLGRVHQHRRQQIQENVVAIRLFRHRIAEGHFQGIHGF